MRVTQPLTHSEAIKAGIERRRKAHAKRVKAQKELDNLWVSGDHRYDTYLRKQWLGFLRDTPGCGCRWCKKPKVLYCKHPECGQPFYPASVGHPVKYCSTRCRMDAKRRRDGVPTLEEYENARYKATDAAWALLPRDEREGREARRERGWREQARRSREKRKAEKTAKAEARLVKAEAKKAKDVSVMRPEPLRLSPPA